MTAKVHRMIKIVRKYARKYPISTVFIAIVWFLSLVPFFPETPLDGVPFIDKWTHLFMYGSMCLAIWGEYWWKHRQPDYKRLFVWAWVMPIVMSGALELIQEYATATRQGEWNDLTANATGVTIGAVIGILLIACFPRR